MYIDIAKEKFNSLRKDYEKKDIIILGIESSCDDTGIAIVKNGREILGSAVNSQIDIHAKFGA